MTRVRSTHPKFRFVKVCALTVALGVSICTAIAKDIATDIKPTPANKERLQVVERFNLLHSTWQKECDGIKFSSRTTDYINLPSYRKLVALGRPALPLFYERLKNTNSLDFMLAQCVVEITGWESGEFRGELGEQEFAAKVVKKLNHEFDATSSTEKPTDAQMLVTLSELVADFGKVTNGMSRADLSEVLDVEGGLSTRQKRTYVHPRCPFLKSDIEFTPGEDKGSTEQRPSDTIRSMSQPYLAWTIAD